MGVSIFSYLTTKRIALAQQMLEDGTPAVDAAYQVGFGDYSVFYRAYRKITGESPAKTKGRAKRGSRSSL
jgi:AraC-like DNA-binding protein